MINAFALTQALQAIGDAEVLVGNPLVVAGMAPLGLIEGDITLETGYNINRLTTERTGDVAHQAQLTPGQVALTFSIALGDTALWAKITGTGAKGMGASAPVSVQETSALLIPKKELGTGLAYNGTAYSGTPGVAPVNAIWLWRCFVTHGPIGYRYGEGGKALADVRIEAMWDATKPEGQKVYTVGDPIAQAIPLVRL